MDTTIDCPKCAGPMSPGRLQEVGHYGNSPIVFAPDGEPTIPVAGIPSARKEIRLLRCDNCGLTEMYSD